MILDKELTEFDMTFADVPDEVIFAASLKNPVLFEVIVNRYKKAFLRKVAPVVAPMGGFSGAEDVVQEAFVKMYVKGHSFSPRGTGSFKSWAYAVLMNTCYSAYRKAHRERTVSIDEHEDIVASIPIEEEPAESKFSFDFAISLIGKLPDTLRRAAEWYFLKGKSHREIASLERTTEGAIRTRIHRAREIMKKLGRDSENKN
ncbi:MAG: RNA polymerase sigma factor [Candidatus Taylorbacteria bacterium]|nr:RNA polymerase sigma factor [Candidatus Taylorbacteria bacterium]